MDVKREPIALEADKEEQQWFEVPLLYPNNQNTGIYIKQEPVDDASCTFEKPSTDPGQLETDFKGSDLNEGYVADTTRESKYEDSQAGCSYLDHGPVNQFIPTTSALTYFPGLESSRSVSEEHGPCDELQIVDINKKLEVYKTLISDIIRCTANLNQMPPFSVFNDLLVPIIKLERKAFHKRNFVCSICFDIFASLYSLKRHKAIHKKLTGNMTMASMQSYKCNICNYRCTRSDSMKLHKMDHSGEKPFKCDQCDYSFKGSNSLKLHIMTHSGERPFKCDQCDYSCTKSSKLKLHQMTHTGEKPFKCDECEYSCITSSKIKLHKMTHSNEKPYKCDECNYSCIQSGHLKAHKLIHSGEKPFKCDQCDFSCTISFVLKRHKMIHWEEKPYKCDQCDYSCITFSKITLHKMTHSGEKPLKCDECHYACKQLVHLKAHKMMHARVKPFTLCDVYFFVGNICFAIQKD